MVCHNGRCGCLFYSSPFDSGSVSVSAESGKKYIYYARRYHSDGAVLRFGRTIPEIQNVPAKEGENADQVLIQYGYTAKEIDFLKEKAII
jgi:crotonobetainyl-CoA:carnitine CoA-transferase CaiB-like acyl-CoA transferase